MIFPYSFLDIVIRRSALESIRKGLSDELIAEYKVEGGHFDKNLIVIRGSMGCGCEKDIIKAIETKYNLVHIKDDVAQDIVCTLRGDVMSKCSWLKVGRLSEELKIGDTTYPKCFPFFEFVQV